MIDLPKTTNVYKQIPKELFYKYLNSDPISKKYFIDEIRSINWINTLSSETMSIQKGKRITEIAIVEIFLNRQAINTKIIEIISREIDQYAIFIVRYEEWGQLWCCDYQSNPQEDRFHCQNYYQTNWMITDDLTLTIEGWNLDLIYENLFMQIEPFPTRAESSDQQADDGVGTAKQLGKSEQLEKLEVAIKKLESQIRKELQFGKQVKLATELKTAKDEVRKIKQSIHIETHQPKTETAQEETSETVRSFFPNVYMKMQNRTGNRIDYSLI